MTVVADDLWFELPVLVGRLVRLEPLGPQHAAGYLAAAGTGGDAEEVFRWMTVAPPATLADAEAQIAAGLAARGERVRFPFAQLDAEGVVIGSTSYYEVSPATRSLGIGHTWLGKKWWRTGVNTEAKLLLLTHAFETLGAARVVWHTDIHNVRSQEAISRLGATREGELRKHRIRRDGSWRTTVQYSMTDDDWPEARERLRARLERG